MQSYDQATGLRPKQKKTAAGPEPLRNPCEVASKYMLPALRVTIARKLIEDYGFTQMTAASKLGVTQSAMSKYMSRKRGKAQSVPEKLEAHLDFLAKEIAGERISPERFIKEMCSMCMIFRDEYSCNCKKQ